MIHLVVIILTCLLVGATGVSARILRNPEMTAVNLGTDCPAWEWSRGAPQVEGDYDQDSTYTLRGNGTGIYWCWDKAGFAFVTEIPLTEDFILIARVRSFPPADTAWMPFSPFEPGNHTVGIAVKASLDTRSPVLDFRWDYVYRNMLTWFNRQTATSQIGLHDTGWKGDKLGTGKSECWEGCLGEGYESGDQLKSWERRDGLWLAVQRKNLEEYYLYVRYSSADSWTPVPAISSGYVPWDSTGALYPSTDWCGLEKKNLQHFKVPYSVNNLVYAGFTVTNRNGGSNLVAAQFDSIELRLGSSAAEGLLTASNKKYGISVPSNKNFGARYENGTFILNAAGPVDPRDVQVISVDGTRIVHFSSDNQLSGPTNEKMTRLRSGKLSPGLYIVKILSVSQSAAVTVLVQE